MKICSFDVGIKNLSYCIVEFKEANFEILEWDIIDVIDSRKQNLCCGVKKKGGTCDKKATFETPNKDKFYCKTHIKQYIEPKTKYNFMSYDGKQRCNNNLSKKNSICGKKARYSINDSFFCLTCHRTLIKKEKNLNSLMKIKKVNTKNISFDNIAILVATKLDERPQLLDVDYILIENQPSLLNPQMKSISNFIYNYFLIRGLIDSNIIHEVKFISPSNKTKASDKTINDIINKIDDDSNIVKFSRMLLIKYNAYDLKKDTEKILDLDKITNYRFLAINICKFMMNKKSIIEDRENIIKMTRAIKKTTNINKRKMESHDKFDKKPVYDITKEIGILYTQNLNKDSDKWLAHLNKFKKKDDLCDAFLQAYHYYFSGAFASK
jgi:hypothetical protein